MSEQLALLRPASRNGQVFPGTSEMCCGADAVNWCPVVRVWWCWCCGASFWHGVRKPSLGRDGQEHHHGYYREGARFNWAGCSLSPPHSNKTDIINRPVPVDGCDCARCESLREQAGGQR